MTLFQVHQVFGFVCLYLAYSLGEIIYVVTKMLKETHQTCVETVIPYRFGELFRKEEE